LTTKAAIFWAISIAVGTTLAIAFAASMSPDAISDQMMTKAALASRSFSGFFNRQSALLPTALGLVLLGGGGYGLLVLANYQGIDWVLYAAVAGSGLYVLKRTFSVAG
jgi:hypothetical protein